jgi:hypothetical protein
MGGLDGTAGLNAANSPVEFSRELDRRTFHCLANQHQAAHASLAAGGGWLQQL